MGANDFDLRCLTKERVKKLADDVTWDVYNKVVDEIPGLDEDDGYDRFNDIVGTEIEFALMELAKPSIKETPHV